MPNTIDQSMFYGAKPPLFEKARWLRENMTEAEKKLWNTLQKNRVCGYRFKPQHPIDIFIADFYCHKLKLVIEVDGGIHKSVEQKNYDIGREAEIENLGVKVIRFTNEEVMEDTREVIGKIIETCLLRKKELSTPNPAAPGLK